MMMGVTNNLVADVRSCKQGLWLRGSVGDRTAPRGLIHVVVSDNRRSPFLDIGKIPAPDVR